MINPSRWFSLPAFSDDAISPKNCDSAGMSLVLVTDVRAASFSTTAATLRSSAASRIVKPFHSPRGIAENTEPSAGSIANSSKNEVTVAVDACASVSHANAVVTSSGP